VDEADGSEGGGQGRERTERRASIRAVGGGPSTRAEGGLRGLVEQRAFQGSPFKLRVEAQTEDALGKGQLFNTAEIAPNDYTVVRSVFEEAQNKWGPCTLDAFSSAATALVPRFWSAKRQAGAAALNAFRQSWTMGERIWAHPPPEKLMQLVELLASATRTAEVIVCAPDWSSNQWYYLLTNLSDEHQKFNAGKLQAVAEDAPARCSEWPICLFHIPARGRPPAEKRDAAALVIQKQFRRIFMKPNEDGARDVGASADAGGDASVDVSNEGGVAAAGGVGSNGGSGGGSPKITKGKAGTPAKTPTHRPTRSQVLRMTSASHH
jgi:hypothetical protein